MNQLAERESWKKTNMKKSRTERNEIDMSECKRRNEDIQHCKDRSSNRSQLLHYTMAVVPYLCTVKEILEI